MSSSMQIDPNPTIQNDLLPVLETTLVEYLKGIDASTRKTEIRSACYKALLEIAENQPDVLLPHWDYLVGLLHCGNGSTQYCAVHLLGPMARVDKTGRFEAILDTFFDLLDDESVMVASHTAAVAGQIALAQPELQSRISKKLFGINHTHFDPERKGLVCSYAIGSFDEYFSQADNPDEIAAFVREQLKSTSPKTRKMAASFLKKWGYASTP